MTSLSSIKYSDNSGYQQPQISASTRRKLESLGIDPTLVTSESQALSMIAARQSEKSFDQYATYKTDSSSDTQQVSSSESDLIAEAKSLAEQLGVSIDNDATFEDITAEISQAITDLVNKSVNDPMALQRAQQYQVQLSQLTDSYNNVSSTTTGLYSAMNFQANSTRYMLGL